MKLLKLLPLFLIATVAFSVTSTAQTYKEKKAYYKPTDGRVFYYITKWHVVNAYKQSLQHTTDSAFYYIDTITVADNEAGILEVQVIGYNDSLSATITGKQIVRYKKVAGTLTLGTKTDVLATETDTQIQNTVQGGAAWSIVAAGNQIYVRIKGKNTYNIYWECLRNRQRKLP